MEQILQSAPYSIVPVSTEREINFTVLKAGEYQFRLVPVLYGFEISPLDKAIGIIIDQPIIDRLGEQIDNFYS